jgi:hypothetical protein
MNILQRIINHSARVNDGHAVPMPGAGVIGAEVILAAIWFTTNSSSRLRVRMAKVFAYFCLAWAASGHYPWRRVGSTYRGRWPPCAD